MRSRFAVSHFLGFAVFLRRSSPTTLSSRSSLSSSFAFLQSIAQQNLVRRPKPPNSSLGLLLPSAHQGSEVHCPRALPQPATFRPQGLFTLSTAYSLQARAGFVSHQQRSWDSPFGAFPSRKVSAALAIGRTHMPFHPPVIPPPQRRAGPTGRDFWAFTLPRVPGDHAGISTQATGCSLGFLPPRACQQKPRPGSRPHSSHALLATGLATSYSGAPESRSTSAWPDPLHPASRMIRTGQPLQGSRTCYALEHSSKQPPGL